MNLLSRGILYTGGVSLVLLAGALPRTAGAQAQGTPAATLPATVVCASAGSQR